MTGTAVAALPGTGDSSQWSDTERALVEAAGLVTGPPNNKRLAPRPVVEAFLLHARRTGLDPIARQIYCIERGGKWGTQVSIDGARLVAERTGQYRGQTPTQWTADGVTWTDVWLSRENPAAARVGVYREGFEQPLVVVATWDAYNAGSPIWKKMPALMLGKCAEMLALRKAFPQDLSGLYSTEEMDQAGGQPREVVQQAERQAAPQAQVMATTAEPVAEPTISRDWLKAARECTDLAQLTAVAEDAQAAGELGLKLDGGGTVMDALRKRRGELEQPTLVDVPKTTTGKRQWVREARLLTTGTEVRDLMKQAIKASAPAQLIEELEAIADTIPDPVAEQPTQAGSWPVAEIPQSGGEWVEQPDGSFAEPDDGPAGVMDDSIGGNQ